MVEIKMNLPKITRDEIFIPKEVREEEKLEKVRNIKISNISDFPNHPFKVVDNEDMEQLTESVKDSGILVPVIVREKENGQYEMISGHRRKRASELAGLETIPCIVKNIDDDEATIIMVDSNLQREKILPSERAFAYKYKLEAIKHQGERTDLIENMNNNTLRPMDTRRKSADIIGKESGESGRQVQRYIRLTYLIKELLELVDEGKIAFRPAVEISYLKEEEQKNLLDFIEYYDSTPSLEQAIKLKKLSQENNLTEEKLGDILSQEKPNQIPKIKFNEDRIREVLPRNITDDKIEDFVVKSIEFYTKHLRNRSLDAR